MLREEFGDKVDFGLKKGEKVKINIGSQNKKDQKPKEDFANSK